MFAAHANGSTSAHASATGAPVHASATWDYGCLDLPRLRERFGSYAEKAAVRPELIGEELFPCMHVQSDGQL